MWNMSNNENENGSLTPIQSVENAFLDALTPEEEKQEVQETEATEIAEEETESEIPEEETLEEGEEETEEQSDEVETEDDEEEEPELYAVKIDGQDYQVSLEELKSGYSRQKDYTRKTQELAELRKVTESQGQDLNAKLNEISEEKALYSELLPKMKAMINNNLREEPDWQYLIDNQPQEYMREKRKWDQMQETLKFADAEMERLKQEDLQAQQVERQRQILEGQKLISERLPSWNDVKVAQDEAQSMALYAKEDLGFTAEELSQISDGRLVLLLRDAWQFSKTKKARSRKPKEAPARVAKPGNSTKIKSNKPLNDAKARLRKSGKTSDAAAVFEKLI